MVRAGRSLVLAQRAHQIHPYFQKAVLVDARNERPLLAQTGGTTKERRARPTASRTQSTNRF